MSTSTKSKGLLDAYRFIGFRPQDRPGGFFGDGVFLAMRLYITTLLFIRAVF